MLFFAIGCPSCQIFECIYSSFHIQSNIHIVSNLFMCMLHQTVQVNTYVAFVLMTLIIIRGLLGRAFPYMLLR